jgi:regulator of RNase E activity RraA
MQSKIHQQLTQVSTATLTSQLLKRGLRRCYMSGVHRLDASMGRIAGPAYTLRYVPYREDRDPMANIGSADHIARRAIEDCPTGAVLVVDACNVLDCAVIGDILMQRLKVRGVAGFVTSGAVRDADAVSEIGLPVYCSGPAAPSSPSGLMPVAVEEPINCGGIAVYPGDMLVADRDGVVVIPPQLVDEVTAGALEQEDIENFIGQLVAAGRPVIGTYPPTESIRAEHAAWVNAGRPDLSC